MAAAREAVGAGELRLNAVARAAGVGQGTLYRHFPTVESLLVAVYRTEVDALVRAGDDLLAAHAPREALAAWFARVADYARVKRHVLRVVEESVRVDLLHDGEAPIARAVGRLLAAGRREGVLRQDVDARDVVLLLGVLTRVAPEEWNDRAPRLLDVLLGGLSAAAPPSSG